VDPDGLLTEIARLAPADYDPARVVTGVNLLLPLGKAAALDKIAGHAADADPPLGLFLLLRVLFEVPRDPGYHPPPRLGASAPPAPRDLRTLPRFPIALVEDVPLLIVTGYTLDGDVEPLRVDVDRFRARGTLRSQPLAPAGGSVDVVAAYRRLYLQAYGSEPSIREVEFVLAQLG